LPRLAIDFYILTRAVLFPAPVEQGNIPLFFLFFFGHVIWPQIIAANNRKQGFLQRFLGRRVEPAAAFYYLTGVA
jgi:hypothetical protein